MAKVTMLNMAGAEAGSIELKDEIFAITPNENAVHAVVKNYLANQRQGTQSAKTRGEVRGGGRKPFRQKGTGRHRQGSSTDPSQIGGGVVFAPKPRDFSKKINKKMKDAALASALSKKLVDNEFTVVNEIALKENKTKEIATLLKNLKLDKTTYLVYDDSDSLIARVAKNIPTVVACHVDLVNVYDLVANKNCLFTQKAVEKLEEVYA